MRLLQSTLLRRCIRTLSSVGLLAALLGAQASAHDARGPHDARGLHFPSAPPLVIGGASEEGESFPWMAFVVNIREEGHMLDLCSGAVVAPRLILTAAHCVEDVKTGQVGGAGEFRVVTGNADWASSSHEVLHVSQAVVYSKFNRHLVNDDAALLALAEPTSAPAIALARPSEDRSWLQAGTGAWLVGWGDTEFAQKLPTTTLRYAETVIQGSRWCKRNAPPFFPRDELCVINAPKETTGGCNGDSGSPLVLDEEGQEEVDLGITSHGYGRCSTRHPGVYTRVDAIYPWVRRWIRSLR